MKLLRACAAVVALIASMSAHAGCDFDDPQVVDPSPKAVARVSGGFTPEFQRFYESRRNAEVLKPEDIERYHAEFHRLVSKYRVQERPSGKGGGAPGASPSSACGLPSEYMDLGPYGIWIVGGYMEDPNFWTNLQLDYLKSKQEHIRECNSRFNACMAAAQAATNTLYAYCGVAAGFNPYIGAGCLLGNEWADYMAKNDCWNEYFRCIGQVCAPVAPDVAQRRLQRPVA